MHSAVGHRKFVTSCNASPTLLNFLILQVFARYNDYRFVAWPCGCVLGHVTILLAFLIKVLTSLIKRVAC